MVNRRAMLIANLGEVGADNYCVGVNKDMENYKGFLKSLLGGLWYDSEVEILHKPGKQAVRQAVQKLKSVDYSKIIFSGHGVYALNVKRSVQAKRSKKNINFG